MATQTMNETPGRNGRIEAETETVRIQEVSREAPRDNRSLVDLLSELATETTTLVKQEINLAKTEMTEKASRMGKDAAAIAVGGAVLYAGMLTLIASAVLILATFDILAAWAAAMILGLLVTIVGAVMVKKGIDDFQETNPAPRKTIQSLKEDKEWAQQQIP
ncbi:MAG: phage holin family protein [Armatimonadaceae bacterium]